MRARRPRLRRPRPTSPRVLALNPAGQLGRAFGTPPTSRRSRPSCTSCSARCGCRSSRRRSCRRRHGAHRLDTRGASSGTRRRRSTLPALDARAGSSAGPADRGGAGAIAWRSLLTRFRTPRTALETFTGAGVGLAAVLVPTLLRDTAGSGAVLVGGAIQLAVLFMSGNSFGSDGPPVTHELLAGAGPSMLARQGALDRHRRLTAGRDRPACWRPRSRGSGGTSWPASCVGVGALLAGAGRAIVQSALVPIAIPDSRQPVRRAARSGKGMMAALLLGARAPERSPSSRCPSRWR